MILLQAFKEESIGKAIVLILHKNDVYHVDVQYCTNVWSPATYYREKSDTNLGVIEDYVLDKYDKSIYDFS